MIRKLCSAFSWCSWSLGVYWRFHHSRGRSKRRTRAIRSDTVEHDARRCASRSTTVELRRALGRSGTFRRSNEGADGVGRAGWTSQDDLLSAEFWRKARDLEAETANLPRGSRADPGDQQSAHRPAGTRREYASWTRGSDRSVRTAEVVDQSTAASPTTVADEGGAGAARCQEGRLVARARAPRGGRPPGCAGCSDVSSMWMCLRRCRTTRVRPGCASSAWFELNRVADAVRRRSCNTS